MSPGHHSPSVLILGAGVFGLTAAIELARRGCSVRVIEPGALPHPNAASTDLSKVVRLEYGADTFYSEWMIESLEGWRRWNAQWRETVYHETGVLMMSRGPLEPGSFEGESLQTLSALGFAPERIHGDVLRSRFPSWNAELYADGFFHALGGFARSGRVIECLAREAAEAGVELLSGFRFDDWIEAGSAIRGAVCNGKRFEADETLVAAGAWTPALLPELAPFLKTIAQPLFYLQPSDARPYQPERFPTFTADIKRTGWYGVPANPEGVVKLANHGPGRALDPGDDRRVSPGESARLREFIEQSFPGLAQARIVRSRVCVYCDSFDGDFWISRHPHRDGLTLASGGSGHAFKFAPVLGTVIADALMARPNPRLNRFRWRTDQPGARKAEAARFEG